MQIKKTFTLIEMLIVVVIIGILAAALIPRLQSVQARARDTKRKADLHQIGTALAIYKEDNGGFNKIFIDYNMNNGRYPIFPGDPITACGGNFSWANNYIMGIRSLLERYMTAIPADPTSDVMRGYDGGNGQICGYGFYILGDGSDITNYSTFHLDGGFMLAARTESDGSSSNWVQNTVALTEGNLGVDSTYASDGTRIGNLVGGDLPWGMYGSRHTPQNPASQKTYNTYTCSRVTFTGSLGDANLSGDCYADKSSDDLRYIYVQ